MKPQRLSLPVVCLFLCSQFLIAQINVTPWQIHEGGDLIPIMPEVLTSQTGNLLHGDSAAFAFANIPFVNDPSWQLLSDYDNGARCDAAGADDLCYDPPLQSILEDAFSNLDFTYFQTLLQYDEATTLSRVQITFEQVDDGARAYVFNELYPDGIYAEGGDARLYLNNVVADLTPFVIPNTVNRIVVVQFDDSRTESYLTSAQLIVEASGSPCNIALLDFTITDETCANANDGFIEVIYGCDDCSGDIIYTIDGGETFQSNGRFENLPPGDYDVVGVVEDQPSCRDTISFGVRTAMDNIPPEITGFGGVSTFSIDCLADLPPISGTIQAVDNCDPDPEIFVEEEFLRDSLGNITTVIRSWIAIDTSGNASGRVIQINITVDNTPPLFVGAEETPDTLLSDCVSILDEPLFELVDNCDTSPEIEFEDTETTSADSNERILTRRWTATDSTGNQNRLEKVYRIFPDTIAPTLEGIASLTAFELECGEPVPTTQPDTLLTATDNCGEAPIVFRSRTVPDTTQADRELLTWTWIARDAAGNIDSFQLVNIIAEDNTPPTIVGIDDFQEVQTLACLNEVMEEPLNLRVEDACDPNPQLTITVDTVLQSDGSTLLIWNYFAVDAANNTVSASIPAFRIIDEEPPVISLPSTIVEAEHNFCEPYQLNASAIGLEVTDNCDSGIPLFISQTQFDAPGTYTVEIFASDESGNRDSLLFNLILEGEEQLFNITAGDDEFIVSNQETLTIITEELLQNDTASDGRMIEVQDFIAIGGDDIGNLVDNFDGTYTFEPDPGATGTVTLTYLVKEDNDAFYNWENKHFYRSILSSFNANQARSAARASTLYGEDGYLTTITSPFENEFLTNYVTQTNAWIGASDEANEGSWSWTGGPEEGQLFWEGDSTGMAVENRYVNWAAGEPSTDEANDFAYYDDLFGTWYASPNENNLVNSYIIEYGSDSTCFNNLVTTAQVTINVVSARPPIDNDLPKVQHQQHITIAPNPFEESTQIQFELIQSQSVQFILYDSQGRQVRAWQFNELPTGPHQLRMEKAHLPNGVYWLQANIGASVHHRKIILTQ